MKATQPGLKVSSGVFQRLNAAMRKVSDETVRLADVFVALKL